MVQIVSRFGQLQIACTSSRSKQQREGAARQSSKVVSWPNSVLVAPLRVALQSYSVAPLGVARPKGAATPPSEKCSPYWAGAHNDATAGICRASGVSATSLLCLHNDCVDWCLHNDCVQILGLDAGENFAVGGRRRSPDGSRCHGEESVRRVSNIGHTANTFAVYYSWHTAK